MIKRIIVFLLFIGCIQSFMVSGLSTVSAKVKTKSLRWRRIMCYNRLIRRMPSAPIENLYSLQSEEEFVIFFNDNKFQDFSLSICDNNGIERFHKYYAQSNLSISVPIKEWRKGTYSAVIKMHGEEFGCSFVITDKE